jgi:hypothetical protein
MSNEVRDLFDRGSGSGTRAQFDLIPSCVGSNYIQHDENGDRSVTREAYAAELAGVPRSDQISASSSTTIHSRRIALGFGFHSNGATQRPARNRASRTARKSRRGSQCANLARQGRTLRRNAGRPQRSRARFRWRPLHPRCRLSAHSRRLRDHERGSVSLLRNKGLQL